MISFSENIRNAGLIEKSYTVVVGVKSVRQSMYTLILYNTYMSLCSAVRKEKNSCGDGGGVGRHTGCHGRGYGVKKGDKN